MMELVDMNSLGLFDFNLILSVQVGFTLHYVIIIHYMLYILNIYIYVVD